MKYIWANPCGFTCCQASDIFAWILYSNYAWYQVQVHSNKKDILGAWAWCLAKSNDLASLLLVGVKGNSGLLMIFFSLILWNIYRRNWFLELGKDNPYISSTPILHTYCFSYCSYFYTPLPKIDLLSNLFLNKIPARIWMR